jgi:hypothetical protein
MLVKFSKGDLLLIPASEGKWAVGQVILKMRRNILLAVFPEFIDSPPGSPGANVTAHGKPELLVETMDLRIRDGSWKVFGNRPISTGIDIPKYKVPVGGGDFFIQDINGNLERPATPDEATRLRGQKSFSPALVENAVRALLGLEAWNLAFDEMRPFNFGDSGRPV